MRNIVFWVAPLLLLTSIEGRSAGQARPPVRNQALVWHAPAPLAFAYWSGAMVVGDMLFTLYNEQRRDPAQCLRLDTGEVIANGVEVPASLAQLRPEELPRRAIVASGLVIAAAAAAEPPGLIAFEPCTLQRRWTVPLQSSETVPALAAVGDRIAAVVASGADRPAAAATGWTYQLFDARSGALVAKGPRLEGRAPDRLFVDGDRIVAVAGLLDHPGEPPRTSFEISALDATDGRRLWRAEAPAGELAVGGGAVVVAEANSLLVLDAATGKERHHLAEPAMSLGGQVALLTEGGRVYYRHGADGGTASTVGAFDLTTGQRLWRRSLALPDVASWALDDDVLYLETDGGFVTALDRRDGGAAWRWSVGRRADLLVTVPRSGRHRLVVSDERGEVWTFARGARPVPPAAPIVVEGRVHVTPDFDRRDPELVIAGRRIETDRQGRFQTVVRARGAAFSVASRVPWAIISGRGRSATLPETTSPPGLLLPAGNPGHHVLNLDARIDYPEDCH